jgi:spermidine/putrescine transport system permease protein
VIPYVVFGISLLLFFHAAGIPRTVLTVVIGHVVITLPYTILVLMPRLQQIDVSPRGGRVRPGREPAADLPLDHAAAAPTGGRVRVPDRLHDLVRRVRGGVVRGRVAADVPIYLYSALRFPNQLPQVIAVAVVVITISLVVVVGAELGRASPSARLGASSAALGRAEQRRVLRSQRAHREPTSSSDDLVGQPVATTAPARVSTWNCVYMPR